jgi:hypothetical protein
MKSSLRHPQPVRLKKRPLTLRRLSRMMNEARAIVKRSQQRKEGL